MLLCLMFSVPRLLSGLCWVGLVLAGGDGLNYRASGVGRYFGTSIKGGVPDDPAMNAIATNFSDFGQYTCEYQMKWDFTEPQQSNFTYELAEVVVDQAEQAGMIMRCHTLVWHQALPSWVTSGQWDSATLLAVMVDHITNVVSHFRGRCYAWDVVNEALYSDGTLRGSANSSWTAEAPSLWYATIGAAYIPQAFAAAHAADRRARLYYNDYGIESAASQARKISGVVAVVDLIRAAGAPVHGIGLQAHLTASEVPPVADLVAALTTFTALGLEVAYTELDVKSPAAAPNRTGEARGYAAAVQACRQVALCRGVTVWGFTERYSWLASLVPPYVGDLFDAGGSKNPSYDAALTAWPCRGWTCLR